MASERLLSPNEQQVRPDALRFAASSPRLLFSAPKTPRQHSAKGLFISYGVLLCLKRMLHFTLYLDVCYLGGCLLMLGTGGGLVEQLCQRFPDLGIIRGHGVR